MPERFVGGLDNKLTGRLVLGDPLAVGDTTLLPVVSVTAGYGQISGTAGGGGGFLLNPVAIVALHNGALQVYSLQQQCSVRQLSNIIDGLELKNVRCNQPG